MKLKKSKAFTLTELLIVVIVIGVLAALVLPKFTRIMETRKTTEAEEMMSAIRTEQERRCSLGKSYTTDFATLGNIVSSSDTAHYSFSLQAEGMLASRKENLAYDLRMPSYSDGRICCDDRVPGNECNSLNKDYMTCTALLARQDYQPDLTCVGDAPGPEDPPDPHNCPGDAPGQMGRCDVNGVMCGTRERRAICDHTTGEWTFQGAQWGMCDPSSCDSDCSGEKPDVTANCSNEDVGITNPYEQAACGSKTREYECNSSTGKWEPTGWDTSGCQAYSRDYQTETLPCSEVDPQYTIGTATRSFSYRCHEGRVVKAYRENMDWNTDDCGAYMWIRWYGSGIEQQIFPTDCYAADLRILWSDDLPPCNETNLNMKVCQSSSTTALPCTHSEGLGGTSSGMHCNYAVYQCVLQ